MNPIWQYSKRGKILFYSCIGICVLIGVFFSEVLTLLGGQLTAVTGLDWRNLSYCSGDSPPFDDRCDWSQYIVIVGTLSFVLYLIQKIIQWIAPGFVASLWLNPRPKVDMQKEWQKTNPRHLFILIAIMVAVVVIAAILSRLWIDSQFQDFQ